MQIQKFVNNWLKLSDPCLSVRYFREKNQPVFKDILRSYTLLKFDNDWQNVLIITFDITLNYITKFMSLSFLIVTGLIL